MPFLQAIAIDWVGHNLARPLVCTPVSCEPGGSQVSKQLLCASHPSITSSAAAGVAASKGEVFNSIGVTHFQIDHE